MSFFIPKRRKEEFMETFADILKDLIDESGLSLRSLAKASGVSSTQYSKYLKGSIPTIDPAYRICKYFHCSFDYLFGLDTKRECCYGNYDLSKFLPRYLGTLKSKQTTNWKFAQKIGFGESCLRHWKNGQIPSLDLIFKIAYNLSVSIDYLIGRTDK